MLTTAADHGSVDATLLLGQAYRTGRSLPKDLAKARYWYKRAAEAGDAVGQMAYGKMLLYGEGGTADPAGAVPWLEKSAEQGNRFAQTTLGTAYQEGSGVPKDDVKAVILFRQAAIQGEPYAMVDLGLLTAIGSGTTKNPLVGYAWVSAGHAGVSEEKKRAVAKMLRDVASLLSKEDVARAKELAKAWHRGVDMAVLAGGAGASGKPESSSKADDGAGVPPKRSGGGTGTGFVVGDKGEVLTNAHVAGDCSTITLHLAGGVSAPATALAIDRVNDLALLSPALGTLPRLAFRDGLPRAGEGVVSVGFPLGSMLATDGNVTTGNVTALAGLRNDPRMLQTTAPVQPGNSGGPLVDLSGNVIGVVSSELVPFKVTRGVAITPQNVNFAIKAEIVRIFLDQYKVSYTTTASGKDRSAADIAEQVKRSTVVVECRR
ncbi:MAG TPA: tetratricopeptide repeat-containing serine protease family protein [Stellaceae bacterium]|nr:tetratricopeptide repeat-containing serine protease family protein [Stellaceae bacterium]